MGLRAWRKTPAGKQTDAAVRVALLGNPNVGKSTLFNRLTGCRQHTGNWPGKTVEVAQGKYVYGGREYQLTDLPGTYSLLGASPEEQVTEEYLTAGDVDIVLVVCDAGCLARNLSLAMQVIARGTPVCLCLNLIDEAKRAGITVDTALLSKKLGVPVAATSAGNGRGLEELKESLRRLADGEFSAAGKILPPEARHFTGNETEKQHFLAREYLRQSQILAHLCSRNSNASAVGLCRLDRLLLGRITGPCLLLVLLALVLYLTLQGANYPSQLLWAALDALGGWLRRGAEGLGLPSLLCGLLLDGAYTTTARVVSVMLPPMAIFFPLFTLLEDFGLLPRVAFLLDHRFSRCGSCGKQALTMCMGFGCNAAGVVGCRIVDSPRERKTAILTNALVPCNGRFPLLLVMISVFFRPHGPLGGLVSAGILLAAVMLSVAMTFLTSAILNKGVFRGEASAFVMELPPYRRPRLLPVLWRSLTDRTVYVLGRAAAVAAPAGIALWCAANVHWQGTSLLLHLCRFLEPAGTLLGIGGAALAAFLLGFPANELVLPILLLALGGGNAAQVLPAAGWTAQTALCVMVFCLFHWPCGTTCLTVYRETGSLFLTAGAILLPTAVGAVLCLLLRLLFLLI